MVQQSQELGINYLVVSCISISGIVQIHHPDNPHGPTYIAPQDNPYLQREGRALSYSCNPISRTFSTSNVHEKSKSQCGLFSQASATDLSDAKVKNDASLGNRVKRLSTLVTQLKQRPSLQKTSSQQSLTKGKFTALQFDSSYHHYRSSYRI